jgi:hypothetical protein
MKYKILVLALCFLLYGYSTSASEGSSGVSCSGLETSYQSSKTRPGSNDHKHCYEDKNTQNNREDPAGVGIDLLIHETESFDLVAEYKRDFNNNENSIFGVIKTKRSLVDIIKGFFNKGE